MGLGKEAPPPNIMEGQGFSISRQDQGEKTDIYWTPTVCQI